MDHPSDLSSKPFGFPLEMAFGEPMIYSSSALQAVTTVECAS